MKPIRSMTAELHLHALDRLGRRRVAVARAQALLDALAQVGALVLALGQVARDQLLAELDLDVAALGDLERATAIASGHSANACAISSLERR